MTDSGQHVRALSHLAFDAVAHPVERGSGEAHFCRTLDAKVVNHFAALAESIGGFGEGDGALCYPRGLATAGSELYVADTENHRVQVFTLGGRHVRSIGPIRQPYAVAVAHGRLFVAQMDGRLKILSLEPQAVPLLPDGLLEPVSLEAALSSCTSAPTEHLKT